MEPEEAKPEDMEPGDVPSMHEGHGPLIKIDTESKPPPKPNRLNRQDAGTACSGGGCSHA